MWDITSPNNILSTALRTNKVSHAYIFEGNSDTLHIAKEFAAALVCGSEKPYGLCENFDHPDIKIVNNELYDTSKANQKTLAVSTLRHMRDEVYLKPYMAERKVYILNDIMTDEAQNSLLKVLEEPPDYCTIIILSENARVLLPTIRSRCIHIRFTQDSQIDKSTDSSITGYIIALLKKDYSAAYDFIYYIKNNKKQAEEILTYINSFFADAWEYKFKNKHVSPDVSQFCNSITDNQMLNIMKICLNYTAKGATASIAECMLLDIWETIHLC